MGRRRVWTWRGWRPECLTILSFRLSFRPDPQNLFLTHVLLRRFLQDYSKCRTRFRTTSRKTPIDISRSQTDSFDSPQRTGALLSRQCCLALGSVSGANGADMTCGTLKGMRIVREQISSLRSAWTVSAGGGRARPRTRYQSSQVQTRHPKSHWRHWFRLRRAELGMRCE